MRRLWKRLRMVSYLHLAVSRTGDALTKSVLSWTVENACCCQSQFVCAANVPTCKKHPLHPLSIVFIAPRARPIVATRQIFPQSKSRTPPNLQAVRHRKNWEMCAWNCHQFHQGSESMSRNLHTKKHKDIWQSSQPSALLNFLDRHEVPAVQLGFRSWPCEAFDLGGWDSQREECHWATNLMHCIWLHLIATSIHKLFIVDYCRPRFKAGEWRFEAIWSTFTEATGGQPSWFRGRGRWGEKFRFSMHSSMHSRWNKNIKNGDCDDCDDYLFLIVQMYSCLCHAGKCCRMFIALAAWGAMFLWKSGFEVQPLNEKTALNHGSCFFDPLWFLWGFEHFCKLQLLLSTNVWSGRVLALQLLLLLELAAGATWNHQTKLGKQSIIGNLPCGRDVLPRSVPRYLLLFLSSW